MHIESENYDFLMYILNAGQPVPSLYTQYYRILGDIPCSLFSDDVTFTTDTLSNINIPDFRSLYCEYQ